MQKLLMGNEAMAFGAIEAGVQVVSGYPGTPSTEVLEAICKNKTEDIHVQWSTNEKVALEVAAGASYAGARSLVTMKQVGLNVASDPLMSLAYIGVKGGMVVLVADDPGPMSSQTEQDTRHFAKYANLVVFDPSTPTEAYELIKEAFAFSEKIGKPVIFRPTTRICHGSETIELKGERQKVEIEGFKKDAGWVIFPPLSLKRHQEIAQYYPKFGKELGEMPFNFMNKKGKLGIATSGVTYTFIKEIIDSYNLEVSLLKITTANPFPNDLARDFLEGLTKALVLEELDPVLEEALIEVAYKNKLAVEILGKKTAHCPFAGEYSYEVILNAMADFLGFVAQNPPSLQEIDLPKRTPVLCAGCPHRASFYAVKVATGEKAIYTGDIGCYTLGNAPPLHMTDTCLCMGAGLTIAQGLKLAKSELPLVAFIGDSTFFHTGIPGIINAIYNQIDITVIVLDNSTTAMTGHQPHPGIGKTMMNTDGGKLDIGLVLKGLGVGFIEEANPFDQKLAQEVVRQAVKFNGVSVVIFKAPCVNLFRSNKIMQVDYEVCVGCHICINKLGCPALYVIEGDTEVAIDPSLCNGCGLCKGLCMMGAIKEKNKEEAGQ